MSRLRDIQIVYPPNPAEQYYRGCLNYLDRDYWNQALEQRNYLHHRPPVQRIYYPQSSQYCLFKGEHPPVLTDPCLNIQSKEYYENYLTPDACHGLPVTPKDFCPITQMCPPSQQSGQPIARPPAQKAPAEKAKSLSTQTHFHFTQNGGNGGNKGFDGCANPDVEKAQTANHYLFPEPQPGQRPVIPGNSPLTQPDLRELKEPDSKFYKTEKGGMAEINSPAVSGVNRNIHRESQLRRLDHYCPTDVTDSRICCWDKYDGLAEAVKFHPENAVMGVKTPRMFKNLTKALNNYDQVVWPKEVNQMSWC